MFLKKLDFNFYLYAVDEYDIMKPLSLGAADRNVKFHRVGGIYGPAGDYDLHGV